MEEYKAILKVINDKLADNERLIDYLRDENSRLERENTELKWDVESSENAYEALSEECRRQDKVISELKEKIKELKGDCNNGN